ncbi:MAG: S9 family peptidase, partial [Gammaproteobacteria bacterium]
YLAPDGRVRDKAAIYEYNFRTRTMGDLVFEHDEVDVSAVVSNEKTRSAIGVAYAVGKPERVWIDERWKQLMASIDQALPDTVNSFTSLDDEESIGVLTATSDRHPTTYYLFDFEKIQLKYLADSRPWMEPAELAEVRPITVTARDGMTLHGYVTLPAGSAGKNLPTVVNPHGGPWARDSWGFNPQLQFLADRGYAVLQVNFRGSTGFGRQHYLAGRKQWGQAMQNDITDTLQWAVEQGITDPDRVCIYGASYGGYAAMAGLTFTPELYKCGINYVGATDLPTLFRTMPDTWNAGKEQMMEMVGDEDADREFLEQWSPVNHADRIQAPVFMAYGLNDPRVTYHHRDLMEKAMDAAGVKYETMTKADEGHGFSKQENVYDFYARVDSFLAEHLQP